jgi:phosphoglycolate phosphatase-like HAD superfamily hydrolase
VLAALDKVGSKDAIMIGDSTWDCEAAKAAKIKSIAVLTGGFSSEELRTAGASDVFESIDALRLSLDDTPLG